MTLGPASREEFTLTWGKSPVGDRNVTVNVWPSRELPHADTSTSWMLGRASRAEATAPATALKGMSAVVSLPTVRVKEPDTGSDAGFRDDARVWLVALEATRLMFTGVSVGYADARGQLKATRHEKPSGICGGRKDGSRSKPRAQPCTHPRDMLH